MIRSTIILAMTACPALADDAIYWGGASNPAFNTGAVIAPADGPAVATVRSHNRLTGGHDTTTSGVISVEGLSVRVTVYHGPGDTPDTVTVIPPEGFIAVPPQMDIPEGGEGVIVIYSADGLGA